MYGITALIIPLVARTTGVPDRFDIAQDAAETVLSSPSGTPHYATYARAGLALLAVLRGEADPAGEQYQALKSGRGRMVQLGFIGVDRLLGLLAQTMGDMDQAVLHFQQSLAFCRSGGYRHEQAWACHDYAAALLAGVHDHASRPDNRGEAMSLLNEALAVSNELGMRPLMRHVVTMQEKTQSLPRRGSAYPDGLTQREVGVLRLVAAGKTDREIAEDLVISVKTVGNHVSNILNKTRASNRTEAATYAAHRGLL